VNPGSTLPSFALRLLYNISMSFQLIKSDHQQFLKNLISHFPDLDLPGFGAQLAALIDRIHQDIPEKRRISIGRYSIVKALGNELFSLLTDQGHSALEIGAQLVDYQEGDIFTRAVGLKLLVESALENGDPAPAQPYFEATAAGEDWITRECASGLVRPLIKSFPDQAREWYLELVKSPNPNLRRFVSESLRPVAENHWFHQEPDYSLEIIEHLFSESAPYPRTSVGNNLSDWMRVDQETAWPVVDRLAHSGDPNSYWIAYRACRNLVKKQPLKVLDLLGVDEYKYKNRVHRREERSNPN